MKRTFMKRECNDCDDDILDAQEFRRSRKMSFDLNKDKHENIEKEIIEREISMNDIFNLDLPINENVWFMEHLRILKELPDNTLERYRIKNMIYEKYIALKNVDRKKLAKIKSETDLSGNIVSKILCSSHPDEVKTILYKKYKRYYDNVSEGNSSDELFKIIEWIENVLDLPTITGIQTTIAQPLSSTDQKLLKLWNSLNSRITGLTHVKEKVMEAMSTKILNPNGKGKILTFVGPPGVGKTAMAFSIAEAMEMPFDQISFGSVKDSSVLTGHSATYIGALPGLFTKILLKSKRLDTVVLLDEIDKIPNNSEGTSIASVLYHVLDKTQNNRFKDMYMPEILIDLSKMVFLLSANSLESIDPLIRDRMTVVEISGYSVQEKIEICSNHVFARIREESGFNSNDITIGKKELQYLIVNKTNVESPGMRDIEKKIEQICERLALLKYTKSVNFSYKCGQIKFPLVITTDIIDKLL
jgi:ATP-dependent Lon protease